MKIDITNKDAIGKQISLHDAVFTGFSYDYENGEIIIQLKEYYYKKEFKIIFFRNF